VTPLLAHALLGTRDEPRFAGRRVETLAVPYEHATRRRLRGTTDAGTDVALDLPSGAFLRHGAVVLDDGDRIVAVERPPQPTAVVRISRALGDDARIAAAARVGHALGNLHLPVEVAGDEIRLPMTVSRDVLDQIVGSVGASALEVHLTDARLAADAPLTGAAAPHAH
jgi:urease accessory protein